MADFNVFNATNIKIPVNSSIPTTQVIDITDSHGDIIWKTKGFTVNANFSIASRVSNCTHAVYYSIDNGSTWVGPLTCTDSGIYATYSDIPYKAKLKVVTTLSQTGYHLRQNGTQVTTDAQNDQNTHEEVLDFSTWYGKIGQPTLGTSYAIGVYVDINYYYRIWTSNNNNQLASITEVGVDRDTSAAVSKTHTAGSKSWYAYGSYVYPITYTINSSSAYYWTSTASDTTQTISASVGCLPANLTHTIIIGNAVLGWERVTSSKTYTRNFYIMYLVQVSMPSTITNTACTGTYQYGSSATGTFTSLATGQTLSNNYFGSGYYVRSGCYARALLVLTNSYFSFHVASSLLSDAIGTIQVTKASFITYNANLNPIYLYGALNISASYSSGTATVTLKNNGPTTIAISGSSAPWIGIRTNTSNTIYTTLNATNSARASSLKRSNSPTMASGGSATQYYYGSSTYPVVYIESFAASQSTVATGATTTASAITMAVTQSGGLPTIVKYRLNFCLTRWAPSVVTTKANVLSGTAPQSSFQTAFSSAIASATTRMARAGTGIYANIGSGQRSAIFLAPNMLVPPVITTTYDVDDGLTLSVYNPNAIPVSFAYTVYKCGAVSFKTGTSSISTGRTTKTVLSALDCESTPGVKIVGTFSASGNTSSATEVMTTDYTSNETA